MTSIDVFLHIRGTPWEAPYKYALEDILIYSCDIYRIYDVYIVPCQNKIYFRINDFYQVIMDILVNISNCFISEIVM